MALHAYALVQDGVGKFRALHLKNVTAESVEYLEPNGRTEPASFGVERINTAMRQRTRKQQWNT